MGIWQLSLTPCQWSHENNKDKLKQKNKNSANTSCTITETQAIHVSHRTFFFHISVTLAKMGRISTVVWGIWQKGQLNLTTVPIQITFVKGRGPVNMCLITTTTFLILCYKTWAFSWSQFLPLRSMCPTQDLASAIWSYNQRSSPKLLWEWHKVIPAV